MDFITYHISTLLRGRDAGATPLEATLDNDDLLRHIVALTRLTRIFRQGGGSTTTWRSSTSSRGCRASCVGSRSSAAPTAACPARCCCAAPASETMSDLCSAMCVWRRSTAAGWFVSIRLTLAISSSRARSVCRHCRLLSSPRSARSPWQAPKLLVPNHKSKDNLNRSYFLIKK